MFSVNTQDMSTVHSSHLKTLAVVLVKNLNTVVTFNTDIFICFDVLFVYSQQRWSCRDGQLS